jgi:hypothetical protein
MLKLCFLLGNSPASEFYMQTFRNTLSVPSSLADRCRMTMFKKCRGIKRKKKGLAEKWPEPVEGRVTGLGWVQLQCR